MRESLNARLSARYCKDVLEPEIKDEFDSAFEDMINLNVAYAVMLNKVNLISKQDAKILIDGFETVRREMTKDDISGDLEDIYFNVERRMFSVVGAEIGGKIHTGRSRNDIHAVMMRLEIRPTVIRILELLLELENLLLEKSKENFGTIITGYTHCQPGQPITLAHYYLGVFNAVSRDFERIIAAYLRLNRSPYGAAAFAGSSFEIDRDMLAELLGFDTIIENTLDCIASRDYLLELLSAYSILASTVSRVATDLHQWATFENGMLEIGGQAAGCSSIMPQKRNPVLLETARHKASYVYGGLMGALSALKCIPFNNSVDICSVTAAYLPAAHEMESSLICLIETIKYSHIREDRALENARVNLCTVTSLAEYMVERENISFTQAHDIVGNISAIVTENGTYISGITNEILRAESLKVLGRTIDISQEDINRVLDPATNVQGKRTVGGPQDESVQKMINDGVNRLMAETSTFKNIIEKLSKCAQLLKNEEEQICK